MANIDYKQLISALQTYGTGTEGDVSKQIQEFIDNNETGIKVIQDPKTGELTLADPEIKIEKTPYNQIEVGDVKLTFGDIDEAQSGKPESQEGDEDGDEDDEEDEKDGNGSGKQKSNKESEGLSKSLHKMARGWGATFDPSIFYTDGKEFKEENDPREAVFANRLKTILRDNQFERKISTKSGSIVFNRLSRYKVTPKIFEKKSEQGGKKYNVEILIDCSGSMHGSRSECAYSACKRIIRILKDVCDINVTIFSVCEYTFGSDEFLQEFPEYIDFDRFAFPMSQTCAGIEVINGKQYVVDITEKMKKKYGDTYTHDAESSREAFDSAKGSGNYEISNIASASKRLMSKQGEKICITLLDGKICNSYYDENRYWAGQPMRTYNHKTYQSSLTRFRAMGIHHYSIGILSQEPLQYFGADYFAYIDKPTQIYGNIMKIMASVVTSTV